MKEVVRTKQVPSQYKVYIAYDGREFTNKKDCKEYELKNNKVDISDIKQKRIRLLDGSGFDVETYAYYITSNDQLSRLKMFLSSYYKISYSEDENSYLYRTWKFVKPEWMIFKYDFSSDYIEYNCLTLHEILEEIVEFKNQFELQ